MTLKRIQLRHRIHFPQLHAAVQKAREENRRLGLPNSFTIGDVIYYELPNDDVVKKSDYDAAEANKAAQRES